MTEKAPKRDERERDFLAETRLIDSGSTQALSRHEEDIALAAELLSSGIINERAISKAVSDWSIHGSVPLADHLCDKGILARDQIEQLQESAQTRVERLRRRLAEGTEAPTTGSSLLLATLEHLDGSGRVAKLFGVTVAASSGDQVERVMEGRYELIRKIGQGGLGRVWLARDSNLNRNVALKEISQGSASDTTIERFRHEAEVTGRLDHPSIVPIYQLGTDQSSGRVFYTMRFLGRSTLQDAINEYHERRHDGDDDPMLLRNLLTAFVNVCQAIGHANSRNVIHRDLKPENVVIDSFGQVIVIDWGLAKIIDDSLVESLVTASSSTESVDRTSEGQVLGTPLYMAPEQAAGRLDELDQRTDIYGLGGILFAIVTGSPPHEQTQRDAVNSGTGARGMISEIARGAAPPARQVDSDADPALEAICQKAMAWRQYARYQHANELADDVQRWMAGEPVSAFNETPRQRLRRWMSHHRILSQSIIAAAIFTLLGLTFMAMLARHNHLVAMDARFNQIQSDVRELESQFRNIAIELAKDVRFLASLPPIQGIISAREGIEGDSEEVWCGRLQSIFQGMLRSDPTYLSLSFEMGEEKGVTDIVRVERNPFDPTLIRVLPSSRLQTMETDELVAAASRLEPGDVRLTVEPRTRHLEKPNARERLSVATPVFSDSSGRWFGMTVIETDITKRVMEVMQGQGAVDYEIFVADGMGHLFVSADPVRGVRLADEGDMIQDLPKAVTQRMSLDANNFEVSEDDRYIAKRFYVDPASRGITIFARIIDKMK